MVQGTVVITGASAGVGRATAVEFARRGWRVALLSRGREGLEGAARDVQAAGGEPMLLQADVADAETVMQCAERVAREWGRFDVWVNCAMATVFAPVRDMSAAEFRRVTEVTYLGYVHGTLAALSHMRRRGGTIVQVGSALAYRAIPLQSAYCASKFAIRGFTDALRSELLAERSPVRLTMVQLPAVNTPQFEWARNKMDRRPRPVAPIFEPEAIAREIFRAARSAPRELWIGRSTVQAIVANMIAPGLLDRFLARRALSGQKAPEPALHRRDNLFEPMGGDFGTHGRFDREAKPTVRAVSSAAARGVLVLGTGALLAMGAAGLLRWR